MLVFSLSRVTFFFHIHLVHPTPVLACAYICLACLVLPTVLFNPCKVTCIVLCLALRPLCCIYEYLPHCIHALCFAFPFSWLRVTYVGLAICKLGDQTHNTLRLQTQTYSHDNPLLLPPLPSFLLLCRDTRSRCVSLSLSCLLSPPLPRTRVLALRALSTFLSLPPSLSLTLIGLDTLRA